MHINQLANAIFSIQIIRKKSLSALAVSKKLLKYITLMSAKIMGMHFIFMDNLNTVVNNEQLTNYHRLTYILFD